MKIFKTAVSRLAKVINIIGAATIFVLAIVVAIDVTGRKIAQSPFMAATELSQVFLVTIIGLGIAYTTLSGGHVRMELVLNRLPGRARQATEVLASFLGVAILSLMSWQTFISGIEWWKRGRTTDILQLPLAPFKIMLAFGAFVTVLVLIIFLVENLRSLFTQRGSKKNVA